MILFKSNAKALDVICEACHCIVAPQCNLGLKMKIAITGASGFIGKQIVPLLRQKGHELLLVGRDIDKLASLYPEEKVTNYQSLKRDALGFDAILHLAILNNNNNDDLETYRSINVVFLKSVLEITKKAGIRSFIYTSTIHVLTTSKESAYSRTKKEAEELLANQSDLKVVNLRLPAVYGKEFAGKLSLLSKIPAFLRNFAFNCVASMKPTVHIKHVATAVEAAMSSEMSKTSIISNSQMDNYVYLALKRLIDISFALFIIIFCWWIFVITWIMIRISSPGPAIFAQPRVGKHGATFTCYKFRTMKVGTKQTGTHETSSSNITTIGKFLRKSKIDELPQVLNILRNELSLIGARPSLTSQLDVINARTERGVLKQLGGITGWSQIHDIDMSTPDRLAEKDAEYLALRSLPLDIKIILATAIGHGRNDKVR